ncbi:hypothetical protein H101_07595 [Trichophyton interdigitale H6]|nr:hypothetical protein H101_07595 [Trichophyton interdigitale H6]
MSTNSSGRRKRRAGTPLEGSNTNTKTTKTTSTSAYNRNFEQKLIDYGVYPKGYEFSEREFQIFEREDTNASKEKLVTTTVLPIINGDISDSKCVGGDYLFGNLAPLTDGTLVNAKPDYFVGARPEQLKPEIRNELNNLSQSATTPKGGPDGSSAVATRQACYNGALGARGIYKLQSYGQEPIFDNNAYTITSTYQAGQLKLYTTHPAAPQESDGRPEYIMTSLRSFAMTDSLDTFRKGATAYRNARDWAKEQRDEFIKSANERHELLSSERESTPEPCSPGRSTLAAK